MVEEARYALVRSGQHLTVAEFAARTGRSEDAARKWVARHRRAGQLVAVRRGRLLLVPSFQLDAQASLNPSAAHVVTQLVGNGMSDWAVWRWATAPNSWLGGAVPAEKLQTDPAAVLRAAAALFQ